MHITKRLFFLAYNFWKFFEYNIYLVALWLRRTFCKCKYNISFWLHLWRTVGGNSRLVKNEHNPNINQEKTASIFYILLNKWLLCSIFYAMLIKYINWTDLANSSATVLCFIMIVPPPQKAGLPSNWIDWSTNYGVNNPTNITCDVKSMWGEFCVFIELKQFNVQVCQDEPA